jgi:ribosomal protein S18 acetylase RimI-like enzyme
MPCTTNISTLQVEAQMGRRCAPEGGFFGSELGMSIFIQSMCVEERHNVSGLVKAVIAPLSYYNLTARESEIAKYDAGSLADLIRDDPLSVLVARDTDLPVGFCISKFDDGLIWLAWVGVLQEYRCKKVAARLLQKLEETAPARGCHKIWADCRTENEVMKRMFPQIGYTQICTVNNHWYKQDFILWEKVIEHDPASSD